MTANTLLMKLIATDAKSFSNEMVEANHTLLMEALEKLKKGTCDFEAVRMICNITNYVYGFNKNKLLSVDIGDEHQAAAKVLAQLDSRNPWKITEQEAPAIEQMIFFWKDILSESSENLVREIQHEIHFKSPQAKQLRSIERRMVHRRKATKPPFSRKKK